MTDKSDEEISDFFDELEGLGAVYQTGKGVRSIKKIVFHSEPTEQTDGQVVGTNGLSAFVDDENTLNIYTKNGEQIYAPKNSSELFACCTDLEAIDFENFNTSLVADMSGMFRHCILLQSLDLSTFDTSDVLDMSNMFCECFSLTDLKLNGFDTSNVLNMSGMFSGLKSIEEYDLSDFDTSNVANMSYMFDCNQSISNFCIENFNTSSVKNFEGIFKDCSELKTLSILNWNFESGENFDDFLLNCNSIQSIKIDASTLDENVIYLPQSFYCGEKLLSYISNENIEYGDDYVQVESLPQNWLQIVSSKLSKSLNSLKSINFVCSDDEITDDNEIVENVGFSYDAQ